MPPSGQLEKQEKTCFLWFSYVFFGFSNWHLSAKKYISGKKALERQEKRKRQKEYCFSVTDIKLVRLKYSQSTDEVETNYRLSTDYEV